MSTLPTSRDFVTLLLNSLPSLSQHNADSNPLNDAPEPVKKQLLSLQVLFPNEFLPALDLLDRRLITRFRIGNGEPLPTTGIDAAAHPDVQVHNAETAQAVNQPMTDSIKSTHCGTTTIHPPLCTTPGNSDTVHYVRSAQQRPSRYSTSYDSTTSYEVRLQAWNCTCPAFAFAAFPSVHPDPPVRIYNDEDTDHDAQNEATGTGAKEWVFGGVSLGESMPPVCKHLLACVLAERCKGIFGSCVEERSVSVETAAGWAAGWGD